MAGENHENLMARAPTPREVARFRKACRDLKRLAESGWHLYLDGTGNMNLMSGPSHEPWLDGGRPRQDRIVAHEGCGAGGGDW
jgi:hypothetical protein